MPVCHSCELSLRISSKSRDPYSEPSAPPLPPQPRGQQVAIVAENSPGQVATKRKYWTAPGRFGVPGLVPVARPTVAESFERFQGLRRVEALGLDPYFRRVSSWAVGSGQEFKGLASGS